MAALMVLAVVPADLDGAEVALAWDLPTHYADGTPLDTLTGCRVYCGTDSQQYTELVDLTNGTDHCTVEGLDDDQAYYFAVTAYDNETRESVYSEELMWAGTSDTNAPVALTNRVTDGLLALYEYGDGSGATIAETSGATPALDLTLQNTNNAVWLPGGGLLLSKTVLDSGIAASNLVASCVTSDQFSVEFWLAPNSLLQGDPISGSRSVIFTLSDSASARNLTIEQQGQLYITRVRTTSTGISGSAGVQGFVSLGLTHLVISYDADGVMHLYLNGVSAATQAVGGALSNWDATYPLFLANEATGGSDWSGLLALTAVYNRALSQDEVDQNFAAGTEAASALAPIIVVQPEAAAVAEPQAVVFDVVAGGTQPLAYQWRRGGVVIEDETETRYTLNPTEFADDGALFDVIISNSYGVVTSAVATLSVTEYVPTPAQIDVGPSNQTVIAGSDATFTVQASGDDPRFYQWRRDGAAFANANQSLYTLQNTSTNDSAATFDVVVSNAYGVATSQVAILTVNPYIPTPPTITAQPAGRSVYEPQPATFSVTATGDAPISYQWYQQLTNGTVIVRGTSREWTIDPTRSVDDGSQITVVLSNIAGVVTSQVALLNVALDLPDPPTIVTPPADTTVMEPASATFSVVAAGDATLYYQWRRGTNLLVDATNLLYVVASTEAALDDGATFDVIVSNAIGVVTSAVAVLTVNTPPDPQAPSISTHPSDATVQEPDTVSFSVAASGAGTVGYQWRRNGVPLAEENGISYWQGSTTAADDDGAQFDVVITNSVGSVTSLVATLTVTPPDPPPSGPDIFFQSRDQIVQEPTAVSFAVVASGAGALSYQWRRDGSPLVDEYGDVYFLDPTHTNDSGAEFDVIVTDSNGSVTSDVARLTVTPMPVPQPPTITAPPASTTVTEPDQAIFQVAATGEGVMSYQWWRDGAALSGENGVFLVVPVTDAVGDDGAQYHVVVSNLNGASTSSVATLSVLVNPGDAVSISGEISYVGSETGLVLVAAFTNAAMDHAPVAFVEQATPGPYVLSNLFAGTYYVGAVMLLEPMPDADHIRYSDPWGMYASTTNLVPIVASEGQVVVGIDVTLQAGTLQNPNLFAVVTASSDFDGDGTSDLGYYYADGGNWHIARSSDGLYETTFGYAGTVPITGDFDGDGISDFGCYYAPGGNWYIYKSSEGFYSTTFGYAGTIPIVGDFDGDGIDDFGCYYAPGGNWYIYKSSEGFYSTTFGYAGTIPITGDFDGDGIDDFGCYDAQGGNWYIYKSSEGFYSTSFGYAGTVPITGDFDGDGIDDFGCYDAQGGNWYIYKSSEGFYSTTFGYAGTVPVIGDYDGDGRDDLGCYYAPGGNWYIFKSRDGFYTTDFGDADTVPLGTVLTAP
jgi:hypothetical protein